MDWKEKILSAMLEIQSACRMNGEWSECRNCPFDTYCTVLITETGLEPSEWGRRKRVSISLLYRPGKKIKQTS